MSYLTGEKARISEQEEGGSVACPNLKKRFPYYNFILKNVYKICSYNPHCVSSVPASVPSVPDAGPDGVQYMFIS